MRFNDSESGSKISSDLKSDSNPGFSSQTSDCAQVFSPLLPRLQQQLHQREQAGLLRRRLRRDSSQQPQQIIDSRTMISFCSNDYLGLANHPQVIAAFQSAAHRYGVGSGASHLVSGHCAAHQLLEEELAAFLGRDKVLLFSTGYMANTGIINALVGADGLVLQDSLNHASLLDGGWLSRAQSQRYPHRNMQALENMLSAAQNAQFNHVLVVSDGVFSMDGDLAPLSELIALTQKTGAWLMIDDAHGIGCLGESGRGIIEIKGELFTQQQVPILVGTLGKAFGTAGAFVAGDADLIDYLVQFARPYVFSTAMPPALAEASRVSLRLLQDEHWRRERLRSLIKQFRDAATALNLPLADSHTSIQAIIFGDVRTTLAASGILAQRGLHVSAIRPPTVPAGTSRLRITLSASHSDEHLQRLISGLEQISCTLTPVTF